MTASSSELLAKLSKLRRVVRRRLMVYGACAVTAGGIVAFLTAVTLDWMLWFPAPLRVLGAVGFVAGFVAAVFHWIVRPWQAPLGLDELARQLERHFGSLEDRLSSAVDFMNDPDVGSSVLVDRVIDDTERLSRHYAFESALSKRPLYKQIARFAFATVVLGVVVVAGQDWARLGLYRYIYPTGQIEWPRTVEITPLTLDTAVAMGESVTVRMEIARGLTDALRGEVHLREPDGREWTLAMQRDADHSFYATIDAVTQDLSFWYVAGDDSTARSPFRVRVVKRPAVVELLATVEPPPYASERSPRVLDLSEGAIEAPVGGFVRIDIAVSKPLARKAGEGEDSDSVDGSLMMVSGGVLPLEADPGDPSKLSCRFRVSDDMAFRIALRDEDGFENRGSSIYTIRAVPDAAPTVTWLAPQSLVEAPPTGSVKLTVRVHDDFGVDSLELEARRSDGTAWPAVSLTENLERIVSQSGVVGVAEYVWSIELLKVAAGDVIVYTGVARDNYTKADGGGQVGRSSQQRIRIISQVEFEVRLRTDLSQIEARIRQVVVEQSQVLDTTVLLTAPSAEDSDRRAARLNEASVDQANLVRRVRELSRRVSEIVDQIDRNLADQEEMRMRVDRLGLALEETASRAMTEAASAMTTATENREPKQQQPALQRAMVAQQRGIDQLRGLLRTMSDWGQFQGLMAKTRGLLERQDGLRSQTSELGRRTLGKTTESLTPDEKIAVKRMERMQRQLAEDTEQVLARMKRWQEREAEKDAAGADAVMQALRAARALDLSRRLDTAAEAIQANRMAAATIEQKGASQAMRKVLRALQGREERQLAELRKRLNELADILARIIEEEQALRAASHEAGLLDPDAAATARLEDEQRRVRRNTQALAGDVGAMPDEADMAGLIRTASGFMMDAEMSLQEGDPASSTESQDSALTVLFEAQEVLNDRADSVDEEMMRRSLAQIREQLEEIRASQAKINEGIVKVFEAVMQNGRLGRAQTREASRLARSQAGVREAVHEVLPELEAVVVFRFAMDRVAAQMDAVRKSLMQRQLDDLLVERSESIIRDLDRLIRAAIETAELPIEEEFVSGSGGGEGGASGPSGSQQKAVPTITELLVLKAMQGEINERTVALHEAMDVEQPAERQLRDLKRIGDDQSEVLRLSELVTERAQRQ